MFQDAQINISDAQFLWTSQNFLIVQCLLVPRMLLRLNIYLEYLQPNIKIILNSLSSGVQQF